jgi:holliday junction DNA helicase RuvA
MISYLKGKVMLFKWGFLILDVNDVGYKVFVSPQIDIKNNIVDTQEDIELYIHQHIREDSSDLYGFLSYQELELFEKLISVNGIGPKAGMNIMSGAKTDRILQAIISDDMTFFTAIPGVGKKVAAKIILELKSKVSADADINVLGKMGDADDLLNALESLGYKKAEIAPFISKIPAEITETEEKVRWCLKNMGKM